MIKNKTMKRFFVSIAILLLIELFGYSQTYVTVIYTDATTEEFSVNENGSLIFSGNNLLIDSGDLNPTTISLDDINKLKFTTTSSVSAEEDADESAIASITSEDIYAYPNPANDLLYIHGLDGQTYDIQIYSAVGSLVRNQKYTDGDAIDISTLQCGLYFIIIKSTIVKFSKL